MASSLVTVILPHYRCERYLYDAARSILAQDHPDLELRVIDDGSKDERWLQALAPLARDPRLLLYRTSENVGCYRIINRMIKMSQSPYIGFQDADDLSAPSRLSRQLKLMRTSGAHIVGCSFIKIDESGNSLFKKRMVRYASLWRRLGKTFVSVHATSLIRRCVFDALGGYDGTARFGADTEFFLRASYLFRIRNTREYLYLNRLRQGSLSLAPETGFGSPAREHYVATIRERERRWHAIKDPAELGAALRAAPNDMPFTVERVFL